LSKGEQIKYRPDMLIQDWIIDMSTSLSIPKTVVIDAALKVLKIIDDTELIPRSELFVVAPGYIKRSLVGPSLVPNEGPFRDQKAENAPHNNNDSYISTNKEFNNKELIITGIMQNATPEQPKKEKSKDPQILSKKQIYELVETYKTETSRGDKWTFTPERRNKLLRRAKEAEKAGYDPYEYCLYAILGTTKCPWNNGSSPENKTGKTFWEWEDHIFSSQERAAKRVEWYEQNCQPSKPKTYVCVRCRQTKEQPFYHGSAKEPICRDCAEEK
jgi:hypothetical protein